MQVLALTAWSRDLLAARMFTKWSNCEAMSSALFLSQVCSRAALARVHLLGVSPCRAHAWRRPERGLKPRDYILDRTNSSSFPWPAPLLAWKMVCAGMV